MNIWASGVISREMLKKQSCLKANAPSSTTAESMKCVCVSVCAHACVSVCDMHILQYLMWGFNVRLLASDGYSEHVSVETHIIPFPWGHRPPSHQRKTCEQLLAVWNLYWKWEIFILTSSHTHSHMHVHLPICTKEFQSWESLFQ